MKQDDEVTCVLVAQEQEKAKKRKD